MRIATWNLNSIRARQDRLLSWLAKESPDLLCLQELKLPTADFPAGAVRDLGYHAVAYGQPSYNGVAILAKSEPTDVLRGFADGEQEDPQARIIAATVDGVRVISAYFPNGEVVGSDKWAYKLVWMERLRAYLERHCDRQQPVVLCGDFNVAPDDHDVANPEGWEGSVLTHPDGRAALAKLAAWGLVDLLRHFHPAGGIWTWWDYQNLGFPKDDGLRIDHVWVTPPMLWRATGVRVDRDERKGKLPSDHAPVVAMFDESAPEGAASAARAESPAGGSAPSAPVAGAKKLVVVDGHSLAYRAFYGLPLYDQRGKISFSNAAGEFTNAVYGFTNMLIKVWNDEKPDYLAVAFDLGRTFRDDMFADYKATREKMPDELSPQIDRIIQVVEAFGIPALTAEGYEADDILGTLSKRAGAEGMDVLIVTGDSDAFQLIDEHVRVLAPGRLWSDTAIWDEAAVEARYGLKPPQLIDYKALCGDTSDNVPGVRGIGDKTAQALLKVYDTVEGIYDHLDAVQPNRAKTALEAGRDMAALSKDLVTIRTTVPLEVAWEACAVHEYDRDRVEALFDDLEFRSIRNRLPAGGVRAGGGGAEAAPGTPGNLGSRGSADRGGVDEAMRAGGGAVGEGGRGAKTDRSDESASAAGAVGSGLDAGGGAVNSALAGAGAPGSTGRSGRPPGGQMALFGGGDRVPSPPRQATTKWEVVRTQEALAALVRQLAAAPVIAFDTESTATDPLTATLVGISLAVEPGSGFYLPTGHVDTMSGQLAPDQLPVVEVLDALRGVMGDPAKPKVAHNAKYDLAILKLAGLEVQGVSFDTMIAEFLIEPSTRLGLKALAKGRLSMEMTEISALIGTGKNQVTMAQVEVEDAAAYAAADADMTLRLMHSQEPELEKHGVRKLFDEVEMPLIPVLLDMELTGVLIDSRMLGEMSVRLGRRMGQLEAEAHQLAGMPFNLNSPAQLGDVLFTRLGLKAPGGRTTATGKASVAADVLDSMRGAHPLVDLALEHRQLAKLRGTYLDALPRLVNPRTGRVHTSFNQTGAVSGRVASQDPNLQNIPIRTELGREVRRAFTVPAGCQLIAADYSQVELRIAAHLTGDPGLRAAFLAGEDVHRATAAAVLGVPVDEVTADQRSFAKRVNFGLLYGMGAQTLAQQAGIPMKEAQKFVDAYFARFPLIKKYIDDTKRLAKEQGYVETLLGRRRYFPILAHETRDARTNVLQRAAEREAINHPMQGSAADIIKVAMIGIHRALAERGLQSRLVLQVHDELLVEAPDVEVPTVTALMRELMEGAFPLDPPLKVDVGVGRNWDEVK